jgi:hypothetical protein
MTGSASGSPGPAPDAGLGSVRVTVTVAVDPATAFVVFTEEIGDWYRAGVATFPRPAPATTLAFAPDLRGPDAETGLRGPNAGVGVGGRLVEVGPDGAGEVVEHARVTVWEPGRRLVFVDRRGTEVDVRFEPAPDGTRVVLEHRGLDRLDPEDARKLGKFGWSRLAAWFESHAANRRTIHD